jgi:hypothetical protein
MTKRIDIVDKDKARRVAAIVKALDYELALIDDNDGSFKSVIAHDSYRGTTYRITFKPFNKKLNDGDHDIEILFETRSSGYRLRDNGKVRLIVEGIYKVANAVQLPQRKNGTHDYKRAIKEATERAKDTALVRDNRDDQRAREEGYEKTLQRVLRKTRVRISSLDTRVSATPGGIRLHVENLTEKQAVALLEAAKAAGVEL